MPINIFFEILQSEEDLENAIEFLVQYTLVTKVKNDQDIHGIRINRELQIEFQKEPALSEEM